LMSTSSSATELPQLGKDPLQSVISALTQQEKINLVMGTGMDFPGLPDELRAPVVGHTNNGRVPGAAGSSFAVERLGIPELVMADGPAGVRITPRREGDDNSYFCTAFPIATLLASSWDVELAHQVGAAMGNETKEYGADILLAPALNIHRIPLGGRNFEYYSEDPLVSGKMAAAMTRGIQSQGVGTSIKHYVANNHEWNRNVIDVQVDQRALREIYLRGFEIAIKESQPWTVMSSYNKVNGTYTSESYELLTKILREEWGFEGFVVTDWFGGTDAIAQLKAGNDLLMPGSVGQQKSLQKALDNGDLDEAVLDKVLEKILTVMLKSPVHSNYQYSDKPDLAKHAEVARSAAAQGMVLLQNNLTTLPLKKGQNIALFGNGSYQMIIGGTGSGDVNNAYTVSLLEGLTSAGFVGHQKLHKSYQTYISAEEAKQVPQPFYLPQPVVAERVLSQQEIEGVALQSDIALITISRNSGEFADREAKNDFYLSDTEKSLIKSVGQRYHDLNKKVVVVLNIGGVIETASWRDQVDAILLAWQPGQEAGHALADVISGQVNPSGKLATTFAMEIQDYPSYEDFPGVVTEPRSAELKSIMPGDQAAEVQYHDGIWVGYRAFNTRKIDTAYAFGFGLSYTQFSYGDVQLTRQEGRDSVQVSIEITNTGPRAGKEVVQLYVSAPKSKLEKPEAELRGFRKTSLLQPKQSQVLSFTINPRDLSSYDLESQQWLAEAGSYIIKLAASSTDIRRTVIFDQQKTVYIPL
ncbi:MAG TPA: beta-glucosidase, partial [Porticoccus sp.]|nr:beta-glucosidase [Porticoccus sp.]